MNSIELDIMKGLVSILNQASDAYYNSGHPIMTDQQFDARLEDLKQLEEETGFVFSNSPTQRVGYRVLSELPEVQHSHPMLSLEKCHTVEEIIKFADNKELVASIKLDGLTTSLTYKNGILVLAETRGDGYVGSDITEHVKQFLNVPCKINKDGTYIVDGEAIITDEDFADINKDGEYKNSRNLASGTLSVLDTSLVAKRRLKFYAWDVIEGGGDNLSKNLAEAKDLGFDVVPFWLNGVTSERASLHNISIMKELLGEEPHIGQSIIVTKSNMIIPQIVRADKRYSGIQDLMLDIPAKCPICGGHTEIKQDNNSKVLVCTNDNCKGKLLGKLTHFCSKNAMDIDNLSSATLEKFIELGWLTKLIDIYYLDANREEMMKLDGFGEKSVRKILNAIEKSKVTTLDRFIYSLSIPDVGLSTAKTIASRFEDYRDFITRASDFDWEELDGIGSQTAFKIMEFIHANKKEIKGIAKELEFKSVAKNVIKENTFINKNICITGKLNHFNRDSINEKILSLGAKPVNSVSSKTDLLVCNALSNSSKYKKAIELNIRIITEDEFIEMIDS